MNRYWIPLYMHRYFQKFLLTMDQMSFDLHRLDYSHQLASRYAVYFLG